MLRAAIVALVFVAWSSVQAQAGGCCCPSCGCGKVKKVCKPVCDVKKETIVSYDCVCEDFCVPGPSVVVGHCTKKDCRGCEHCCPIRKPTCASIHTRSKLIKHTVEVEKPTIKWVVQTVCCGCGCVCGPSSCTHGCADGSCTQGQPGAAPAAPGVPPAPPSPMKDASFDPQAGVPLFE